MVLMGYLYVETQSVSYYSSTYSMWLASSTLNFINARVSSNFVIISCLSLNLWAYPTLYKILDQKLQVSF